jgi:hypothetical protein
MIDLHFLDHSLQEEYLEHSEQILRHSCNLERLDESELEVVELITFNGKVLDLPKSLRFRLAADVLTN